MKEYNEQVVETLDDAGCIIANKNIIIDNLQAKFAELEGKIERLKRQSANRLIGLCKGGEDNDELRAQLAAEQLNNKLLREALQEYIDEHEECQDADDWMAMMCSVEAHHAADEALSQPSDTSALDAYVAEKVKEAGKFDVWKTNPYTKVLEISIKQLTKQRDLAVDALEKASDGIKAELSDNWTCNSYHPKLFAGEKAIDEALSAIKESEGKG